MLHLSFAQAQWNACLRMSHLTLLWDINIVKSDAWGLSTGSGHLSGTLLKGPVEMWQEPATFQSQVQRFNLLSQSLAREYMLLVKVPFLSYVVLLYLYQIKSDYAKFTIHLNSLSSSMLLTLGSLKIYKQDTAFSTPSTGTYDHGQKIH